MTLVKNLVGERFNNLVVQEDFIKDGIRWIKCKCDCGNFTIIRAHNRKQVLSCGCSYRNDLTNQRFDSLIAIKYLRTTEPHHRVYWLCQCDCGKFIEVTSKNLIRKSTKNCGDRNIHKHYKYKGYQDIPGSLFHRMKDGARKRNHEFDITIEQMWELFLKQNKKCALSGRDIDFGDFNIITQYRKTTASLDRIDSKKGYTIDNVQWVHRDINMMKHIYDQGYFISTCREIVLVADSKGIKCQ